MGTGAAIHRADLPRRPAGRRRGFTMIELLVAGVITAFVLGSVSMSILQLSQAKAIGRQRYDAHRRAHAALSAMRADIAATIRADDLFWTRFLLRDDSVSSPHGRLDRDELLIFSSQLRQVRHLDYQGEGADYESHYRIEDDELGPALMHRRDPVLDEFDRGGGVVTPLVEGAISLSIQAYDGDAWLDEWDSDEDGLPEAVSITIMAAGESSAELAYSIDTPLAALRTVVAIDRVMQPMEPPEEGEEEGLDLSETGVGLPSNPEQLAPPGSGGGGGFVPGRGDGRRGGDGGGGLRDGPRGGGGRGGGGSFSPTQGGRGGGS